MPARSAAAPRSAVSPGLVLSILPREGAQDRGLAIAADLSNPRHPVRTVIVVLVRILQHVDRFPLHGDSGRRPGSFGLQNSLHLAVGRYLPDTPPASGRRVYCPPCIDSQPPQVWQFFLREALDDVLVAVCDLDRLGHGGDFPARGDLVYGLG